MGSGSAQSFVRSFWTKRIFYGKRILHTTCTAPCAPSHPELFMMPLCVRGKVVSCTYADSGKLQPTTVPLVALEVFANQAALALENALLRRQQAGTNP